ncbi:MAG: NAD(P)H-binding protein [Phenylobacterium sp.]|uniref:NAD(P)-dependent oxidoreductase n=1 Tax=Phenylobacterium sp. TaxID=1871053 RepID=UPI002733EFE0|nr:NAD(P)H-binding protein [Phenylobacterium sp.]MDP3175793.1 NAD(P)H-binding protein [Phenylobacterium sp.]
MKIAYIGASGEVGKRATAELVARGHQVTGISTHPDDIPKIEGLTAKAGDINDTDTLVPLLRGHDVVISSVQFVKYDHDKLIEAVKASGVPRYFVCGGSGTLLAPGTQTRIMDLPTFPAAAAGSASNAARFFGRLQEEKDLDWTYLSPPPPPGFAPGERTGKYRLGKDEMLVGPDGKPGISYEDYAIAIADEIDNRKHSGRFTVGY